LARIRTIKPEFPHSESMGAISRDARLCFIMMFTIADDAGRLRGNSRILASLLFPYDDDAPDKMEDWIAELIRTACIVRYQVNGSTYIEIANWLEHQKIDHPTRSKIPSPIESSDIFARDGENFALDLDLGPGMEGKGTKEREAAPALADAQPQQRKATAKRLSEDWKPSSDEIAYAEQLGLDPVRQELDFREYWLAKGGEGARKTDWRLTWQTWCRRSADRAKARGSPTGQQRMSPAAYANSLRNKPT
jgi:hypothetical protein